MLLNHYIRFDLNDLKVLEHYKHVQRTCKGDFLTQDNLGKPHPFRMKSGQNADISRANLIPPMRFQGAF